MPRGALGRAKQLTLRMKCLKNVFGNGLNLSVFPLKLPY
jgi:hypothetical protein